MPALQIEQPDPALYDPERFEATRRKGEYEPPSIWPPRLGDPMWWVGGLAETLPFMAGTAVASLAGGPLAALGVAGSVEGGHSYNEATEAGITGPRRLLISASVGLVNGLLELAGVETAIGPIKKALGKKGMRLLTRRAGTELAEKVLKTGFRATAGRVGRQAVKTSLVEGVTETMQELVSMMAAQLGYDVEYTWQQYVDGLTQSGLLGTAAGGVFGGGGQMLGELVTRSRQDALADAKSASRTDVAEALGVERVPPELRSKPAREAAVAEAMTQRERMAEAQRMLKEEPLSEAERAAVPEVGGVPALRGAENWWQTDEGWMARATEWNNLLFGEALPADDFMAGTAWEPKPRPFDLSKNTLESLTYIRRVWTISRQMPELLDAWLHQMAYPEDAGEVSATMREKLAQVAARFPGLTTGEAQDARMLGERTNLRGREFEAALARAEGAALPAGRTPAAIEMVAAEPVVPPARQERASKALAKAEAAEAKIQALAEKLQAEREPGEAVRNLEQLVASIRKASEETGLTMPVLELLWKIKDVDILVEIGKDKAATPEQKALRRQALDAQKELRQIRKSVEGMQGEVRTPLTDYVKAQGPILHQPGGSFGTEIAEYLEGKPKGLKGLFKKVRKRADLTRAMTLDEMAAQATGADIDFAGDENALLDALEWEARQKAEGVKDVRQILVEAERGEQEQGIEQTTLDRYEAAESAYEESLDRLRQVEAGKLVMQGLPELVEMEQSLVERLEALRGLESLAAEAETKESKATIANLQKVADAARKKAQNIISGALDLRQKIVLQAKKRGWNTTKRRAFVKRVGGTTGRLSQITDTSILRKVYDALRAEPVGPKISPAALAKAKKAGLTQSAFEYDPTGEATAEDMLRARVKGSGASGNIVVADVDAIIGYRTLQARKAAAKGLVTQLVERAGTTGKRVIRGMRVPAHTLRSGAAAAVSFYDVGMARIERIMEQLDGMTDGPHVREIFEKLNAAIQDFKLLVDKDHHDFDAFLEQEGIDPDKVYGEFREILPGVDPFDSSGVIAVYLANLDEGQRPKLLKQFSEEEVAQIIGAMTPQERAMAGWMKDYYESLWEATSAVVEILTGHEMGRVENYYPTHDADPGLPEAEQDIITDMLGTIYDRTLVEHGMAEHRVGGKRPLALDAIGNLYRSMSRFRRFQATAATVAELGDVLRDDEWRSAVEAKVGGRNVYKQIMKWFKQSNGLEHNPRDWSDRIGSALRRNVATATIGFNLASMLRAPLSFFTAASQFIDKNDNLA